MIALWFVVFQPPSVMFALITQAFIWGNPIQVAHAHAQLDAFETLLRAEKQERKKHPEKWSKTVALDGRRENRNERRSKVDELVEQHRKFGASAEFDYEVSAALF